MLHQQVSQSIRKDVQLRVRIDPLIGAQSNSLRRAVDAPLKKMLQPGRRHLRFPGFPLVWQGAAPPPIGLHPHRRHRPTAFTVRPTPTGVSRSMCSR